MGGGGAEYKNTDQLRSKLNNSSSILWRELRSYQGSPQINLAGSIWGSFWGTRRSRGVPWSKLYSDKKRVTKHLEGIQNVSVPNLLCMPFLKLFWTKIWPETIGSHERRGANALLFYVCFLSNFIVARELSHCTRLNLSRVIRLYQFYCDLINLTVFKFIMNRRILLYQDYCD